MSVIQHMFAIEGVLQVQLHYIDFLFDTLNLSLCQISTCMHVPLTCAFCVHSNVCALIITIFIRYNTVVNSILSTSPPLQKYHHMTSGSVEVPLDTTAGNSSSIGKVPVAQGSLLKRISVRTSTARSIVSHAAQGIITCTNVFSSHETVVIEYHTFECEPNLT